MCSHSDLELPVLPSHFSISRLVGDTATPSLVLFLFLVELPNAVNVFDVDLPPTLRSCQLSSSLLPINSVPSLSDGISRLASPLPPGPLWSVLREVRCDTQSRV